MPADGAQHNNPPANPFEEVKPRISEYTAREIALLQGRLQQQLGPEFISTRKGPGGKNVHYIASDKVIGLANDVFGFNGWSSTIKDIQVDFVDENVQTRRVDVGLSVIVRVTLRDGTFHEDIGYGHIENCSGKAAAFEKAKKEGTTDALKRTLRNFGNVLGNCVYDKDYLAKVTKIRVRPTRFSEDNLHRHVDFAPAKQDEGSGGNAERSSNGDTTMQATGSDGLSAANPSKDSTSPDDFVSVDFDEADFSFSEFDAPDEMMTEVKPAPAQVSAQNAGQSRPNLPQQSASRAAASFPAGRTNPPNPSRPPHPSVNMNSRPLPPGAHAQPHTHGQGQRPGMNAANPGGSFRHGNARPGPNPAAPHHNVSRPAHSTTSVPNTNTGPNQQNVGAPQSNGTPARPVSVPPQAQGQNTAAPLPPPEGPIPPGAPKGFVTSRDAVTAQSAAAPVPAFNPKAESPSIRRTAGFDHTKTASVKRVSVPWTSPAGNQLPPPPPPGAAAQSETSRRVGAPMPHNSPLANRNQFKPVGKRPADSEIHNNQSAANSSNVHSASRPALSDVTAGAVNTAGLNAGSGPPDPKKPKLENETPNGPNPASGNNTVAK